MPVMDFLTESHNVMLSHGVKLYAEIFVNAQGERQYTSFESEKTICSPVILMILHITLFSFPATPYKI